MNTLNLLSEQLNTLTKSMSDEDVAFFKQHFVNYSTLYVKAQDKIFDRLDFYNNPYNKTEDGTLLFHEEPEEYVSDEEFKAPIYKYINEQKISEQQSLKLDELSEVLYRYKGKFKNTSEIAENFLADIESTLAEEDMMFFEQNFGTYYKLNSDSEKLNFVKQRSISPFREECLNSFCSSCEPFSKDFKRLNDYFREDLLRQKQSSWLNDYLSKTDAFLQVDEAIQLKRFSTKDCDNYLELKNQQSANLVYISNNINSRETMLRLLDKPNKNAFKFIVSPKAVQKEQDKLENWKKEINELKEQWQKIAGLPFPHAIAGKGIIEMPQDDMADINEATIFNDLSYNKIFKIQSLEFNDDELTEIYKCLQDTSCGQYKISDSDRMKIAKIGFKIEQAIPNIQERIYVETNENTTAQPQAAQIEAEFEM